jgi:hypothetical protein
VNLLNNRAAVGHVTEESEGDEGGKPEEPKPPREEEEDGEAQDRRLATWGIDLLGLSARVRKRNPFSRIALMS